MKYLLTCLLILGTFLTYAQEPEMDEQMAAYMAKIQPNDHHAFLAKMAGQWNFKMTMYNGSSAESHAGVAMGEMVMGGRYLQTKHLSNMGGFAFEGLGTDAYDTFKEEFVSTWIDNYGTGIMVTKGTRDGNTITHTGESINPMTGKTEKQRMVIKLIDDNHFMMESFTVQDNGQEVKNMEVDYHRDMEGK